MKVYSIGRETGCDIVITDSTDVISRRHALLNVYPSGKMTIVDQSHNGTYVNGIRISQNVPVPVTRKDNISFAHIARLDWNRVPKPVNVWMYVGIGIAAIIIIVGGIFAGMHFSKSDTTPVNGSPTEVAVPDYLKKKKADETVVKAGSQQDDEKGEAKTVTPKKKASTKKAEKITDKVKATTEEKITTEKKTTTDEPKAEQKCAKCGKDISKCEYNGNHPTTSRSDR